MKTRRWITEAEAFAQVQGVLERAEREISADEYDNLLRDLANIIAERRQAINTPLDLELPR